MRTRVPKKRRPPPERLVDGNYSRVWGLIPEDQDVAFNRYGERDNSLPDRDDIAVLLSSGQYSLKSTCVNPHAIAFLERTTELRGAILYIVDIMDNAGPTTLQAMIGLGRGSPQTIEETLPSDPALPQREGDPYPDPSPYGGENFSVHDRRGYDTLAPSEWLQVVKEFAFDRETTFIDRMVDGRVNMTRDDAAVLKQIFDHMSKNDPFACFYIDWACSATVFKTLDGKEVDPRRPGSEKGAGSLLVQRMAEYIDTAYVLPTASIALRELWPGVNTGMLTHAESLAQVTKWVRRRAWIKLWSLAEARVFWEDVMGFQQLGYTYDRNKEKGMCRLVFPDLTSPVPPPKGPKPLFGTELPRSLSSSSGSDDDDMDEEDNDEDDEYDDDDEDEVHLSGQGKGKASPVVVPASVYDGDRDVVVVPAKNVTPVPPSYIPAPKPPIEELSDDEDEDGSDGGGDAVDDDVMSRYMGFLGHNGDSSDDEGDASPRRAQRQRTAAAAATGIRSSKAGLPCLSKLAL